MEILSGLTVGKKSRSQGKISLSLKWVISKTGPAQMFQEDRRIICLACVRNARLDPLNHTCSGLCSCFRTFPQLTLTKRGERLVLSAPFPRVAGKGDLSVLPGRTGPRFSVCGGGGSGVLGLMLSSCRVRLSKHVPALHPRRQEALRSNFSLG